MGFFFFFGGDFDEVFAILSFGASLWEHSHFSIQKFQEELLVGSRKRKEGY
jgi:hypothetical protein